jgi:hypothetical protein
MVNLMPLTLRRRPRLPHPEPEAPADNPRPVAAEPAPEAPATAPRRTRRRRTRTDDWLGRLLGEAFFFLVGLTAWVVNAIFTILGVTAALGASLGGILVGLAVHLGISRAELYLWHRWRDPWYLALLVGCVLIDVGTTLGGVVTLVAARAPQLLGGAPVNVLQWHPLVTSLVSGASLPIWTVNALFLLALATGLALGSERLMRKFWTGLIETWHERGATI